METVILYILVVIFIVISKFYFQNAPYFLKFHSNCTTIMIIYLFVLCTEYTYSHAPISQIQFFWTSFSGISYAVFVCACICISVHVCVLYARKF